MSNISFYNPVGQSTGPHCAAGVFTLQDFLNFVKFGRWQDDVTKVRNEKDKGKRTALKKLCQSVTISGTFNERKEALILEHSGFICIDIDNFTDKSKILIDPYTYSCFDSISANGFCIIVKIDPKKHKESFRWLQKYYYESYHITVDSAPQNPASLRYISYDPNLFLNEKSKLSKTIAKDPPKPKSLPVVLGSDKVAEYVREAVGLGYDLAADYKSYFNLSCAIWDGFGEAGREYFHALCQVSPKYNAPDADKQYTIASKRGRNDISVGTFYFMLQQAGIHIQPESNNYLANAILSKKQGKSKAAAIAQLVERDNVTETTAQLVVEQVWQRSDLTLQTITVDPERLIETLENYMTKNHKLKRNLITKMIEEDGENLTRERFNTIYLRTRAIFNTPNVTYDLVERMIISEYTPAYNPIKFYIENNMHRESTGHLDKLVQSIVTNSPMASIFIRKWCISIIAAYDGYPVRSLLALLGGQYTGKTEWFRRLLPKDLQKYYGESKLDAGKDDELLMCSKLILMNDEMGGKSKHDEKLLKELTSKSVFSLRAPYGRHNEDFKRLAILCGTSNEIDIMQDPTGNTRILPIEVISIDHDLYNKINKDDLFMECYHAYKAGEHWTLTAAELEQLKGLSKNYEGINYERECIDEHFVVSTEAGFTEELTATQLKNYIETNSKQQIKNMKNFGRELKLLFGKSIQRKGVGYVYRVIKKTESHRPVQIGRASCRERVSSPV